jgi:multidrug efflux pump subunit AcrA (membrane-fusion protein)
MDPQARTFFVVAELSDQMGRLTPGMSVSAWLPVGSRDTQLTVPSDAVIRDAASAFVYKVHQDSADSHAVRVPVRVLFQVAGKVAVAAQDLSPHDRVVIEGNERLLPGTKVALSPTAGDHDVSRTARLAPGPSDQPPRARPPQQTEPSATNHHQ